MVEAFTESEVRGWVSVPADSPPTEVELRLGSMTVSRTTATPDGAMSASRKNAKGSPTPSLPPPKGDRRNSRGQIRTFTFAISQLWDYAPKGTPLRVVVGSQVLPIHGHGMFLRAPRSGGQTPRDLQKRFDEGHLLGRTGVVQISKRLDEVWQSAVSSLYESTRALFAEEFGYDLFITYGTLLGAIREGGFLAHDNDYDTSFVSSATTGPEAADEMVSIAKVLIAKGYRVGAMGGGLHVYHPARPQHRIDIFHIYFDADGVLQHPFGYAGARQITSADWKGTREIEFVGRPALVPVCAEELLATFYGEDWRLPKTAFIWSVEKRGNDRTGVMTSSRLTEVYWADYYAHNVHADASTFARFVQDRLGSAPLTVIDVGCGDGRDSIYFATQGRKVLGLDRAGVAIEHAREKAAQGGLDGARFEVCDLADGARLAEVLDDAVDRPLIFYSRFVLHAVDVRTQAALLDAIDAQARTGDLFVAEFRTDKDEERVKVHPKHYRRYQSAAAFLADLRERGWVIDYDVESDGLAPWGDEDPVLCRAIARQP
ncbi:class I SAM-dependent methyltransferase [Nocardioides sp. T2.26MG-1]|uniref:class I SAM-dependent methyltransferase n=1 Tax=Nocardioides sp. T2.26MG-1 TaxID=3041166 RepID=UPI00247759FD|nr:methyltransferase domain-containing protein [Nocardioides sp. T2.26MG-1]CAI9407772.1 hypothetical protein HIDPHFAB_04854 [Nocardioides sp. T2.26MG-1]